jgi:signal transduction histidine kinase
MMGLILSHDAGGISARRMLMVTLLTLPVLGWIQAKAQGQNGFKPQFGAAILVIVSVVIFAVMIIRTSLVLRELDSKRRDAEEQLLRSHSELEALVERRTIALRHLSARLMQSQDEERRRIARELHDGLGQYLTALSINLDRIARDLSGSAGLVEECRDLIGRTSSEIRTLSHLLHPPLLDEVGFASAARWYVEGFANRSGVTINLDIPPSLSRMSQDTETGLFRILQEGLTNIHRHSGSDRADIRIDVDGDLLQFSIRDYGKGIAPAALQRWQADGTAGVGLTGMRERVNELGGKLDISSTASGTMITVTVPTEWRSEIENRATA